MRVLTLLVLMFIGTLAQAQLQTPAPSPTATLKQNVGITSVEIVYSRPSVKGRVIFGDLVPFDKIWRTGANAATKVTFNDDVKVAGKDLKKGTYAMYTIPGKTSWDIIFYSDLNKGGGLTMENFEKEKEVLRVSASPAAMPISMETFTIDVGDITNNGFLLSLLWDKTWVGIPVTLNTVDAVQASIDKLMNGPSGYEYFAAASYYSNEGIDNAQALKWFNKAIENDYEKFWVLRQKSLLEAKMGNYKDAISTAKKSLEMATEAGNADYMKLNKDSIAEWMKM